MENALHIASENKEKLEQAQAADEVKPRADSTVRAKQYRGEWSEQNGLEVKARADSTEQNGLELNPVAEVSMPHTATDNEVAVIRL